MYHVTLRGTPYEAGRQLGAALAKAGKFILDGVPFPTTEERRAFAGACVPIYRRHFPALLEEVRGLADSQGCPVEELEAVLLSMYAMPPACRCSSFALANGRATLLGRNSDFLPELEEENANVLYLDGGGRPRLTGNTTAFLELEDGVNRHGLAVGLTSVAPEGIRPGFNAGLLLRYLLETCRTTEEAVQAVRALPIASAQTLTLVDAGGAAAVVECTAERVEILWPRPDRPWVCAANRFHSPQLIRPRGASEEDWFAEERYRTLLETLEKEGEGMDSAAARDLLAGRFGFLCQYDRSAGMDTVWSVVYDLREETIWRAEGNPSRCEFREDTRFFDS